MLMYSWTPSILDWGVLVANAWTATCIRNITVATSMDHVGFWAEGAPPGIPLSRAESFINIPPHVLTSVKQENYIVLLSLPSNGNPYAPIDSSNIFFSNVRLRGVISSP